MSEEPPPGEVEVPAAEAADEDAGMGTLYHSRAPMLHWYWDSMNHTALHLLFFSKKKSIQSLTNGL